MGWTGDRKVYICICGLYNGARLPRLLSTILYLLSETETHYFAGRRNISTCTCLTLLYTLCKYTSYGWITID